MAKRSVNIRPLHLRTGRSVNESRFRYFHEHSDDEIEATHEFGEFDDLHLAYVSLLRAKCYIALAREKAT